MNGIEILNTTEVVDGLDCNNEAVMITFLLCFGILTIAGVITSICEREVVYVAAGIVSGVAFGFCFSLVVCLATVQPGKVETYYQVTINDSVSFNEFLDKYEIIDQEGKIYTVKERE